MLRAFRSLLIFVVTIGEAVALQFASSKDAADAQGLDLPGCLLPPEGFVVKLSVSSPKELVSFMKESKHVKAEGISGDLPPHSRGEGYDVLFRYVGGVIGELNDEIFPLRFQFNMSMDTLNFDAPASVEATSVGCSTTAGLRTKAVLETEHLNDTKSGAMGGNLVITSCLEPYRGAPTSGKGAPYILERHKNCGFVLMVLWDGDENTSLGIKEGLLEAQSGEKELIDGNGQLVVRDKAPFCSSLTVCIGNGHSIAGFLAKDLYEPIHPVARPYPAVNVHAR